ncbi:MAG TPA: hypothetical protein VFL98_00895 [Candidatus Paceibacterota bacterium]|nr:hypothetical protein [Candidatus Paceibacterota bacterium]
MSGDTGSGAIIWWVSQQPPSATSAPALRAIIADRAAVLAQQSRDIPSDPISTLLTQHEDRIRVAVYAMLSASNLLGENGGGVAEVAEGIKETAAVAYFAEAQMAFRSKTWRFIFGGDQAAASQLASYAQQLGVQDQQLGVLLATCTGCDPGAVAILEEQLAVLEKEQQRLAQVAQDEAADGGVLGSFGSMFGSSTQE